MPSPMIELIYCAEGNVRFVDIAIEQGYTYGSQLPGSFKRPIEFADQDWKKPNREAYMKALETHRPRMATVLDLEEPGQYNDVMAWAEEASQYVTETVIVIPKCDDVIARFPRRINDRELRLGYSVPTKYGGTTLHVGHFHGWPVHLLGGHPRKQLELSYYMDIHSADGNYAKKIAIQYCEYFNGRTFNKFPEHDRAELNMYDAFKLSCQNTMRVWRERYDFRNTA